MSFDRYRAQLFCESIFGCSDFAQFYNTHHSSIESYKLDKRSAFTLSNYLKEDAKDFYFKGCQSLTESLSNYNNRLYSWAVIKAYYSIFYMIKADFALKDFALIRHKCIYYLQAKDGSVLITKGRTNRNRTDYSGDHKSALNYYIDLFSNSDILLSQEIDGMNAYQWLMKKREQVNYQERDFKEPDHPVFLDYINSRIIAGELLKLIEEIIGDTGHILTFQPEFAPIAIPMRRALLTKKSFFDNGIADILTQVQIDHFKRFEPYAFV
ncbi:MAG TPA: HEPN domain-containing protein [Saprospiraceae bacterium]|nr:HEPN domain-containing protein [Saprospiraceae bacterium]